MSCYRAIPLALAALLPLATAGCGSSGITATSDDPIVLSYEADFANNLFVPDTTIGVRLRYDSATGCLMLTSGHRSWVPLWPEGTTALADENGRGVDYPEFGPVYADKAVAAAGAGWAHPLGDLVDEKDLAGCSASEGTFVVTGIRGAG